MSDFLPPITRRVVYAIVALTCGAVTNALYKNIVSGLVILISSVALSVWLGMQLSKSPKDRDPDA